MFQPECHNNKAIIDFKTVKGLKLFRSCSQVDIGNIWN